MDALRDLKTLTLPSSTKVFIVALLVLSVATDAALFVYSLISHHLEVLPASIQFFGGLLPIILVTAALARADTGVVALRRRTEAFFVRILPQVLTGIPEEPRDVYAPSRGARSPIRSTRAVVRLNHRRGDCYSDFLIFVPTPEAPDRWRALVMRLEVNVERINFNLCVPTVFCAGADAGEIRARFKHTLQGALGAHSSGRSEGYVFLDKPMERMFAGLKMNCLVGSRFVAREFLWDSAEQLYFAQDLMFMLRAFLSEDPESFPVVSQGPGFAGARDYVEAVERHAKTLRRAGAAGAPS